MKKYNIIKTLTLALFSVMLVFSGCEKTFEEALDRADDSRENIEGMLSDPDKVWGMLNAAYAGIPQDRSDIYFWTSEESLTDNGFDVQGQSMGNWRSGLLTPSFVAVAACRSTGNGYTNYHAGGASWWGRYWGAVRMCNTLIENVDNITVPLEKLPQSDRDQMKDEAIALRAFFHLKLISLYGPLPFMDENLPVDFSGWGEMVRPTFDEVANRIADDLQGVIDRGNIPMKRDPFNVNDKYRMPLGFVYGLKSRVLLYNASPLNNPSGDQAKYAAAAAAAKQFIDLGVHALVPFEETKKMYISPIAENLEEFEVIWRSRGRLNQLSNVHGMDLNSANPKRCNYKNHKAGETPSQEIVDCYELKNGAMVIQEYDETHAIPTFTPEAIAAGYDDINDPYGQFGGPARDDRLSRDILFNGNYFGESYQMGDITVWTYKGAPGTGSNGNAVTGNAKATYTGYYYAKDRDPLWYGKGSKGGGNGRCHHHSILMRYAEIYLNYAEALCGAGQFDEACAALDMTRMRANQPSIYDAPDFVAGDFTWLMRRIQNERRVELVLEDHRLYDVRRWDIISNKNNNTISGMEIEQVITESDTSYVHTRYQSPFTWACHNEKYKILPIPLSDKKLLPNLEQPEAWQ